MDHALLLCIVLAGWGLQLRGSKMLRELYRKIKLLEKYTKHVFNHDTIKSYNISLTPISNTIKIIDKLRSSSQISNTKTEPVHQLSATARAVCLKRDLVVPSSDAGWGGMAHLRVSRHWRGNDEPPRFHTSLILFMSLTQQRAAHQIRQEEPRAHLESSGS